MRYWLIFFSIVLMPLCYAIDNEVAVTLSSRSKESLEFGSTYSFKLTFYPYDLDKLNTESFETDDVIPFIHMVDVGDIKRSENNYDAIVVDFKGIVTAKYTTDRRYSLKLGDINLPLILEIPNHGVAPKDLNEFTILGHEKPNEGFNYYLLLIIFGIFFLLYLMFWLSKKNKKKTLYEDICDHMKKYTENKQLEYLYERRSEIINAYSDSKDFFDKIGALQYRKGWSELDKTELNREKNKVIEGLNGTR